MSFASFRFVFKSMSEVSGQISVSDLYDLMQTEVATSHSCDTSGETHGCDQNILYTG